MVNETKSTLLMHYSLYLANSIVIFMMTMPVLSSRLNTWWLDNLINLQLQWIILSVGLTLIAILINSKISRLLIPIYLSLALYNISPFYFHDQIPLNTNETLRIAQLNVHYHNTHLPEVIEKLIDEEYDVILLQEVSDNKLTSLSKLSIYYPYTIGTSTLTHSPSGLVMFSRWPIQNQKFIA